MQHTLATKLCQQFLIRHRLRADQYDPREILDAFLDEMGKGLAGQTSSLAMIPSYIPLPGQPPRERTVLAVDAGGTHFRTALIRFDAASVPHAEYRTTHAMPGAEGELSREEFFDRIAGYLQPVIGESDRLAFCFSYPALIGRDRDGTLLYWTKEIRAPQVVGGKILANLAIALRRRGLPCPAHGLILNDTVAALLAGCAATGFAPGTEYVGFILGTGTNTAYIERNSAIRKEPDLPAGCMAINCEAANFNRIRRGDIDLAFDGDTALPGKYVLEKMISGAYLGGLCHRILLTAAEEGVLGGAAARDVQAARIYEPRQVGALLSGPPADDDVGAGEDPHEQWPEEDRAAAREIVTAVVERAALITAVNMAAPIVKPVREGRRPDRFCVSADGSVYFKLPSFRERAERHLASILGPHSIDYQIVHVEDATLIGTAVAGLV
jgi:hexokinase